MLRVHSSQPSSELLSDENHLAGLQALKVVHLTYDNAMPHSSSSTRRTNFKTVTSW